MYADARQLGLENTVVMTMPRGSGSRRRSGRLALAQRVMAILLTCCALLVIGRWVVGAMPSTMPVAAPVHLDAQDESWMLVLVNGKHPIAPYQPELTELRGGQAVDARCYPDLQRMFDDARAEGLAPKVNSSYRSRDEQQRVLDDTIAAGMADGLSEGEARRQALRTVAKPGTSEHETGLAIDVTSESQTYEDNAAVWDWMIARSWEYGWILRYPADKTGITGIDNEPWHFRYVGAEAAREMHERGQCLEEYLGQA